MTHAEAAALRAAMRETSDDLLAYLERRVRVREDAADLLAETMLQAWRRVKDIPDDPERRRMWLFTIAAHVLANHRRSVRRRGNLADRVRQHLAAGPAETVDVGEVLAVRDAVRQLHDAHRELVMLIHWDGFSIVEAAELLGLNASTARSRYSAARAALREALRESMTPSG